MPTDNWLLDLAKIFGGDKYRLLLSCIPRWSAVYQAGNMWAGFLSYADACKNVLGLTGLKCWDAFDPYMRAGMYGGFRVMHPEFCIVSEFPTEIHMDDQNRPHRDGGPSHVWADGWKLWHLHGVAVPQYLAETDAGQLDIKFWKHETNADVKAEFVRKYGVERLLEYGKKIDSYGKYDDPMYILSEYELWDMADIFDGLDYVPALKMRNPTTGVWHVEYVDPSCRSIPDAIRYRHDGHDVKQVTIK